VHGDTSPHLNTDVNSGHSRPNMSTNASKLQRGINNLLNARERALLRDVLESYQATRNVRDLTRSLGRLLDTPAKRDLLNSLRSVIPTADQCMFDQLTAGQSTRSKSDDRMVKKEFDVLSTVRMPAAYYDTVPARRANKVVHIYYLYALATISTR